MGYKNIRLTVIKGINKDNVYPLETDRITIGRGDENNIVFNIAEVSRTHAEITRSDEGYMIKDLGSTNGTYVDKKKVGKKYLLKPGDMIMLGDAIHILYQADPDSGETLVAPHPVESLKDAATAATPRPEPAPVQAKPSTPALEGLSKDQMTEEKSGRKTWLWAGLGCLAVIIFLIVAGLILIDVFNLWCSPPIDTLFKFIYTCP